jgi:hypothetical protein
MQQSFICLGTLIYTIFLAVQNLIYMRHACASPRWLASTCRPSPMMLLQCLCCCSCALLHLRLLRRDGRTPVSLTEVVGQHLASIVSKGHARDAVRANAAPPRTGCGCRWCEVAHTLYTPQSRHTAMQESGSACVQHKCSTCSCTFQHRHHLHSLTGGAMQSQRCPTTRLQLHCCSSCSNTEFIGYQMCAIHQQQAVTSLQMCMLLQS